MEKIIRARLKQKHGSRDYWSSQIDFIPLSGELIVYDDHKLYTDEQNQRHNVPGFKVGDGVTPINSLPFVDAELEKELLEHIADTEAHLQAGEREEWNNKISLRIEGNVAYFE